MFHHFTMNGIWLMLFLHERKQILVLVKQFTSASSVEMFLSSRHYSHSSSFSQLVVCKRRNLDKAFKFSKWSGPSDMNESQSWSLPSLNFLSADLTWRDMYIWLSLLNPCLHSDETRYNLNNWCFWLLSFWICSVKATTDDCKCLNVLNRIRSKNSKKKTFRNNSWLVDGHEVSGVAKGGRSAPGGTFMGAGLWAMLWGINLQRLHWNKGGFNVGTLLAVEGRFWFWVI